MKNFLLIACLLCCQIIVSQCSLEHIAKQLQMPLELLTECRDLTGTLESNLGEFLATPAENVKASRKADLIDSVGCFLACVMEKSGLINGVTIERGVLTEVLESLPNSNSGRVARLVKHVEACADSVNGLKYQCEVGLTFWQCVHTRPTHRQ